MTAEGFSLMAIGLVFIFFRLFTRVYTLGWSGIKSDDILMIVAGVAYSAETALSYSVTTYWLGLANNGMTDAERAALDPSSHEHYLRVNGSKTQVAGWSTYTFLLWTLKASMCAFYLRLMKGLDYHRRIYIGFCIIFTSWVTVLLSILLGCRPMSKNWQIYPNPGNYCQPAISRIDIFVTVVLNVITDVYLLSIPVPMLWAANLRPTKKLGLIVLFSGGAFVTVAGILRCVLILTNPVTGAQQAGSWAVRETFVAVVTSNAPIIFPLLRRWCIPIFGSMHSKASVHGGQQHPSGPSKQSATGSASGSGASGGSGVLGLGALSSKLGFGNGTGSDSRGFGSNTGSKAGMYVLEENVGEHERGIEHQITDGLNRHRQSSMVPKITFSESEECGFGDGSVIDDEEKQQHLPQRQWTQPQPPVQVQSQRQQPLQQKRKTKGKLRVEEYQMTDSRPSTDQPYVTALSPPLGGIRISRDLSQQQLPISTGGSDTSGEDHLDKVLQSSSTRTSYGETGKAARTVSDASSSGRSSAGIYEAAFATSTASPLSMPSWYSTGSTLVGAGASDNKRGSTMMGGSRKM
ncbi:hypothetical protein CMQ_2482 [Grosmannia clavigera kw1407]|uniref:Rhodopsin domain-containing protein n=1 Tax=Grosmannia clavigera (strain kw1407 / UAMH 11150) TaxID=655863 RepID=F0XJG1_GROCL|nr:uncharacterized protein CMQ_2482 [Grosmannia clavigera kw1407]EFX02433.1 hypothetical protein CMQ_2482 [Grosmannia clavigera kw1407]